MKRLDLGCCRNLMPLVGNIVLLAERTKSCGDRDAPSLGLSQASVPALWGARGMIKKEKKKQLKHVIADTLGFLETFLQKHRVDKESWLSRFEMLNLLNCLVSQFLCDS